MAVTTVGYYVGPNQYFSVQGNDATIKGIGSVSYANEAALLADYDAAYTTNAVAVSVKPGCTKLTSDGKLTVLRVPGTHT